MIVGKVGPDLGRPFRNKTDTTGKWNFKWFRDQGAERDGPIVATQA